MTYYCSTILRSLPISFGWLKGRRLDGEACYDTTAGAWPCNDQPLFAFQACPQQNQSPHAGHVGACTFAAHQRQNKSTSKVQPHFCCELVHPLGVSQCPSTKRSTMHRPSQTSEHELDPLTGVVTADFLFLFFLGVCMHVLQACITRLGAHAVPSFWWFSLLASMSLTSSQYTAHYTLLLLRLTFSSLLCMRPPVQSGSMMGANHLLLRLLIVCLTGLPR